MKKVISLFLSFILISQVSLFAYKDMTTEEVSNYCRFSHNKKECSYYNDFGRKVNDSWDKYDHSIFNYQETEYYKLSPYELYEKYREVSSDIDYLWGRNPEYIDAKIKNWIKKVAIAANITVDMVIIGAAIGPILTNAGLKISGAMIEIVPTGVAHEVITTGVSIRAVLQTLKTAVGTVRFWADLGLAFVLMTGDALIAEGAFYTFGQLDNELEDILLDHEVGFNAVKTRDLLKEILDSGSSSSDSDLETDIKDLKNRTEQELQLYSNMSWQNDTLEHRLLHREAVVTLYALEYVRAEMANLKDYLRFRKAALDIGQVYLSGNLTNLTDRQELHEMIKAAVIQREMKERAQMRMDEQRVRNNPWGESLYWTRFGIHM